MNKLILMSMMIFFISNAANAENPAVPSCACNDFSALLKSDKQIEEQTKSEIEQMDYEAQHLKEKSHTQPLPALEKTRHWWQFWR